MMQGWIVLVVAGCGRVGFDAGLDAIGNDTNIDMIDDAPNVAPCPALPGLLFCESFEDEPLLPFTVGTVESTDVRAYRGTRSQHTQTTASDDPSWAIGKVLPLVASGDLHARWYVYLPSSVTTARFSMVHLVEDELPYQGVIYALRDGVAEIQNSRTDTIAASTLVMPRDRWVCMQMHVVIASSGGSFDGSLDGQPISGAANEDTLPVAAYSNVHSGIYATTSNPIEVWIDEVAVGTQPIPCD